MMITIQRTHLHNFYTREVLFNRIKEAQYLSTRSTAKVKYR